MQTATPSVINMISQLIAQPSISCSQPDWDQSNLAVIELLANWLKPLGFEVEILPLAGRPGKANLIATLGSGPGGLVLSGHTDTVPYNEGKWQSDPFALTERDNRFYGLGSCDMKAFFALAIEAAKSYLDTPLQAPLIILATADEESSMDGARALASLGRPKARYAVIGEPTGLRPIRQHKGIMMEGIKVTGRSGHSSNPKLGNSALDAMHEVLGELIAFRAELQRDYRNSGFEIEVPTLNLGCIHGGDNPNRICGNCDLEFDLRQLPGMDSDLLRETIVRRLAPLASKHQVTIDCQPLFPSIPAFESQAELALIKSCEQLTGHVAESVAFATEAPFLQQLGMQTVVLGPGSIDQAHQPDEFLHSDFINPTISLLQALIERYCVNEVQ